jgi:hypothetical protein
MPIITIPKSERGLVVQALADPSFLPSLEANPAAVLGRTVDASEQAHPGDLLISGTLPEPATCTAGTATSRARARQSGWLRQCG